MINKIHNPHNTSSEELNTLVITNLLDRAARVIENPNLESDNEKRELVESLRNISSSIAATDVPQFVRDIKYGYSDTKTSSGAEGLEESQWFDPIYESMSEMIVGTPRQLPPAIDRLRVGLTYKLRHGRIVRLVDTIGTIVSTGLPASFRTGEGELFCSNGANASYVGDDIMKLVKPTLNSVGSYGDYEEVGPNNRPMSTFHITDVPFNALKVDSVVIGINGVKGRITSTFHDVHVSPDSDPKYVFIRWDDQQKDIRYTYERLMYVKLDLIEEFEEAIRKDEQERIHPST